VDPPVAGVGITRKNIAVLLANRMNATRPSKASSRASADNCATRRNAWVVATYCSDQGELSKAGLFDPRAIRALVPKQIASGKPLEMLDGARRLHIRAGSTPCVREVGWRRRWRARVCPPLRASATLTDISALRAALDPLCVAAEAWPYGSLRAVHASRYWGVRLICRRSIEWCAMRGHRSHAPAASLGRSPPNNKSNCIAPPRDA
jgi:hypothetical protein